MQNPQALELLAQLNELDVPAGIGVGLDAVSWWPLALGWWAVIITSVILLSLGSMGLIQRHRRGRYRQAALLQLKTVGAIQARGHYLTSLTSLLKQTAIAAYPQHRTHIISLYGEAWTDWLNAQAPKAQLDNQAKTALTEGLYQKDIKFSKKHLQGIAQNWIRHHRRNAGGPAHV